MLGQLPGEGLASFIAELQDGLERGKVEALGERREANADPCELELPASPRSEQAPACPTFDPRVREAADDHQYRDGVADPQNRAGKPHPAELQERQQEAQSEPR